MGTSKVSIPFIAGQWSLLSVAQTVSERDLMFQSPSLRGSGRFCESDAEALITRLVSIPFIAGQWSLRPSPHGGWAREEKVSIPFIAGQWSLPLRICDRLLRICEFQSPSLRGSGRFDADSWTWAKERNEFQSPSLRGSGRFCSSPPPRPPYGGRFNPLHCGAVVASLGDQGLHVVVQVFQSPSLRGSGRFGSGTGAQRRTARCFNPLHCGAVVASIARTVPERDLVNVSIPFIAGQWSLLPPPKGGASRLHLFQSPSLRGSGRFTLKLLLR